MDNKVKHLDCIIGMKNFEDKYFDLAVVDPPYGGSIMKKNKKQRHSTKYSSYRNKTIPTKEYFDELFRVSKEFIIFGSQYMLEYLPPGGSFIVWDKKADPDKHNMSAVDVAYYSKRVQIRKFEGHWCGAVKCENERTIHIHQKPVKLYEWIFSKYLPNGGKVLDTHLGSGSSRIAADKRKNIEFYGFEIDEKHFYDQEKRFENYKKQLILF